MSWLGWVLGGLAGWTAIGTAGTLLSLATRDRQRARRSVAWIAGVWLFYLTVLFGVSALQPVKVLHLGQEECFESMCFSVSGIREIGEFKGQGSGRLLIVGLRIRNAGPETAGVTDLRGYLVDTTGTRWAQTPGLSGVPLTVRVPSSAIVQSEPVFRLEGDVPPETLSLVLTRDWSGWGWLTIGNSDSLRHHRTRLMLR